MDKTLTLVIPTYNMEAYLSHCLNSLIVSEDLMSKLEVLVVNDGSKDRSSEIAHKFEQMYPQTFRVIDKENGNYGSCINRGLAEAEGRYIKVLDADDWFDTTEFSNFLSEIEKTHVNMILSGFNIVKNETKEVSLAYQANVENMKVLSFQHMDYDKLGVWMMHAVTYETDLLRSIHYHQTEGISYTDTEWTYIPLSSIDSFVFYKGPIYQYLIGREGQTMDGKVLLRSVNQHEIIAKRLIEYVDNLPEEKKKGFAYLTIERQIQFLVELIYKTRLIKQNKDQYDYDNVKLSQFDHYLSEKRPQLFEDLNKLTIKDNIPLHYVKYWRKFGKRFPVDIPRDIYRKIKYR